MIGCTPMWMPPWRSRALGINPRQYSEILGPQGAAMRYWQTQANPAVRAKFVKLPRAVLETLFRRLRRWTWYRDIGGERYYLLYRGLKPSELAAAGGSSPGATVTFAERASYTPDPMVAVQFAMRYSSRAVGVWVPESAIVTAPFALGKEFVRDYAHGEMEIIVDPFTGILQDEKLTQYGGDFCAFTPSSTCLFAGWMGNVDHPWFKESERRLAEHTRRLEAGKDTSSFTFQVLNPTNYRVRPPTPDSKTSRGF